MVRKMHQRTAKYMPRAKRKPRARRLKSFKSEQAAEQWAKSMGLKDYSIVRLRLGLSSKYSVKSK